MSEVIDEVSLFAEWFVMKALNAKNNITDRQIQAIQSAKAYLGQGWTLDDLREEIEAFIKMYPQMVRNIYHMQEVIGNKQPKANLMERDTFYYHNLLRKTPGPVRMSIKNGKVERISEQFFLEMIGRFTLEELMDHFYEVNGMTPSENMRRQDEGRFRYLLANYSLDEILFSIDASKIIRMEQHQQPMRNCFDLQNYIGHAQELISNKKNTHQSMGINRVFKKEG